ncbi:MAG: iron transporter [Gammaproteobacteria bacterium]|nr:iron transporter [Gammaproteobacteria bacterium]
MSKLKLNGVGKYNIKYRVKAPNLMLHMDKETAPKKWCTPFIITWDLTYLGVGKKGGY